MIIILKKEAAESQVNGLISLLESKNIQPHVSRGSMQTIVGCVGDVSRLDPGILEALDGVESVQRIQEPFKAANRKFHPEDTVVDCSGVKVGGGSFSVIAGPCSVESEEQIVAIAKSVKASGATMLRGGAFKPRTSPYAFQGLGKVGLDMLLTAKRETGLPIVTELMDFKDIELFNDVDVIQIGARNMQNFNLLKEVGSYTKKPILLIHGEADDFVPCEMSRRIAAANFDLIDFQPFPEAGHGLSYLVDNNRYTALVRDFCKRIFAEENPS
jgi:3-deoxy-7-phosphoheptulonate synthase